jgi:uncharacterized protein (DUF1810 family)
MDLERFIRAQDSGGTYQQAVAELRNGHKTSHWMWFIFPQIAGLGHSAMAQAYAISDLAEARAYLAHRGLSAQQIFGGIDAMKLRSSMTLFANADPDREIFKRVIDQYFAGPDPETERRI